MTGTTLIVVLILAAIAGVVIGVLAVFILIARGIRETIGRSMNW